MSLAIFRTDIESLEKLLANLWTSPLQSEYESLHSYGKIEEKCEEIAYNLSIAFWLSKVSEKPRNIRLYSLFSLMNERKTKEMLEGTRNYSVANKIFLTLETSSLLFSLKNMLQELNIDELLEELAARKPKLSKKSRMKHENNYNILLIYTIIIEVLHMILYKISQKKLNEKIYRDFTESLNNYITKISHCDYTLILCELLLKLLYFQLKHLKILVPTLRNSRDCFLINRKLAVCLLEIVEKTVELPRKVSELSQFSRKRLENLLHRTQEFRLKTAIVYSSQKLITSSWKQTQAFKRITLKSQEDFLIDFSPLRYDQIFKNRKLYASYFMDYMQLDTEILLKLALANGLFNESQSLISEFLLNSRSLQSSIQLFTSVSEKASKLAVSQEISEETPSALSSELFALLATEFSENLSESFKFLADFALVSETFLQHALPLLEEAEKRLKTTDFREISLFSDYFSRIRLLVEHALANLQVSSTYTISSLLSDTKNIENLAVEPALLLEHLSQKTSEKQLLVRLAEKLRNQSEFSANLTDFELSRLISSTVELLSKKSPENAGVNNFVQLFFKYLMDLGEIVKESLEKSLRNAKTEGNYGSFNEFNYGLLLLVDPKITLAAVIFLLKCEKESLKLAKLMKINILDVLLYEDHAETLGKWPLLSLFNVNKVKDFRVKTRIISFIFELERNYEEYQFRFNEKTHVELPIFSVLAMLTQDLASYKKHKQVIY